MLALLLESNPTSIALIKEVSLKDMWSICTPGEWHNHLWYRCSRGCEVICIGGVVTEVAQYGWGRTRIMDVGVRCCRQDIRRCWMRDVQHWAGDVQHWAGDVQHWMSVSVSPPVATGGAVQVQIRRNNKCTRCMALASKGWALCPWDLWTSLCRWRMVGVIVLFVQEGVRHVWGIIPAQFNHPIFRRL